MVEREENAYLLPAALFLGLAFADSAATFQLLFGLPARFYLRYVAVFTWIMLTVAVLLNIVIVDFNASNYFVSISYFPALQAGSYLAGGLTTIGIAILYLLRLRLFMKPAAPIFASMIFLAFIVIGANSVFNVLGIIVNSKKAFNPSQQTDSSLIQILDFVSPIATATDGLFSIIACLMFLSHLNVKEDSDFLRIRGRVFRKEAVRLVLIILSHLFTSLLNMYSWQFGVNYVTRVADFLPLLSDAMALYTFLNVSFNAQKELDQNMSERKE